jgi:hypothetical protein
MVLDICYVFEIGPCPWFREEGIVYADLISDLFIGHINKSCFKNCFFVDEYFEGRSEKAVFKATYSKGGGKCHNAVSICIFQ